MNVLITGASRGIGRALALAFGGAGHGVAINYRSRKEEAESVAADLKRRGASADLFPGDVSDPAQAEALVDSVVQKWGRIDGLINNAGIVRDRTLLKMTGEEWRESIDTNLPAPP